MKDLAIALENRPGALAEMGEALGRAGVSVEGGGAFVTHGEGVAHFLFADGAAARAALEGAGIRVLAEHDVLVQRLNQAEPGQVVDNLPAGRAVSAAWALEQSQNCDRQATGSTT
jgi:prepilin-type processing-associated H-X9-DG protein